MNHCSIGKRPGINISLSKGVNPCKGRVINCSGGENLDRATIYCGSRVGNMNISKGCISGIFNRKGIVYHITGIYASISAVINCAAFYQLYIRTVVSINYQYITFCCTGIGSQYTKCNPLEPCGIGKRACIIGCGSCPRYINKSYIISTLLPLIQKSTITI